MGVAHTEPSHRVKLLYLHYVRFGVSRSWRSSHSVDLEVRSDRYHGEPVNRRDRALPVRFSGIY